jgi:hypothetical protein
MTRELSDAPIPFPSVTRFEDSATLEEIGEVSLKGLSQAVAVFKMIQ